MNTQAETDKARIRQVSDRLYQATRPLRILSHISWPSSVRRQFFARGARELPVVSYPSFDPAATLAAVAEARQMIRGTSGIDRWLGRHADDIENSAMLLASCATPQFYRYSRELFGTPGEVLADETNTALDLAQRFDAMLASLGSLDLGAPPDACILAQTVADEMRTAVHRMFGDDAPSIELVDELSANALAGRKRIRIRRSAAFTDKDVAQLIQHEAFIHVATALNGAAQTDLKILGASHPGTTKTQEGLAVFAEFITGSIDLDRMRRLADRVIAIQMAIDGADFLEVYRFFLDRIDSAEQSFENARRVFRGGVLTGGAPFTKDIVYLDGLLRVHNFLRAIVAANRADCLRLLFCGKLDIEDVPVLVQLTRMGLCKAPQYLPPWAADLRFLLCYLTYSGFLNRIDLAQVKAHYAEMLAGSDRLDA